MNWATHRVTNQVPDLCDYNPYAIDTALREAVRREAAGPYDAALDAYGARLGAGDTIALARQVNVVKPELESFDRWGRRVDRVHFHPGWHRFLGMAFEQGMNAAAWSESCAGAQVGRAATFFLHGQIESGSLCPITMTSASIPVLRREAWFGDVSAQLLSRRYDSRDIAVSQKQGMMVGMGMTEKQGGSDLRSNTTQAFPLRQPGRGQPYRLVGHKWFFSSPVSDAHLVLAQSDGEFSCFYVPRIGPDGTRNAIVIERLKDKMGNASNASAEVEFQDAYGVLVGEPGRGIATLVEMAAYTRLDCILGSAALLRQTLVQAMHHARHRQTFGHVLVDHALMRRVLVDLALESEAATTLAMHLAHMLDTGATELDRAWRRVLVPAAKFWVCKRAIEAAAECMEVWGGNGYIEEGPMPRFYREAPVNSIWEGSGNIMCLDVLRALERDPALADTLCGELTRACADDAALAGRIDALVDALAAPESVRQSYARYIAREFVLLYQAVLLRRHAPDAVADAFIASRIRTPGFGVFGAGTWNCAASAILERAWPA
jgi:putative acyl-CoA dehydrogenase